MNHFLIDNLPSRENVFSVFLQTNFAEFCQGKQNISIFRDKIHKIFVELLKMKFPRQEILEFSLEILVISPGYIYSYTIQPQRFLLTSFIEVRKETPFELKSLKIKRKYSPFLLQNLKSLI